MTGFMNSDGSALIGGQLPSGAGQALQLDGSGNTKVALGAQLPAGTNQIGTIDVIDRLARLLGAVQLLDSGGTNKLSIDVAGKIGINNLPAEQAINLNQVNGSALSTSNPLLVEQNIQNWIRVAQGFNSTSGAQSTGGAVNSVAFSLFNASNSGKNVYLFSLKVMANLSSVFALINLVTTDPNLTAAQTNNLSIGGAAPAAHATYSNTAQTPTGTTIDRMIVPSNLMQLELFSNGAGLLLPSGANNGLVVYVNLTGAANWTITARWVEY